MSSLTTGTQMTAITAAFTRMPERDQNHNICISNDRNRGELLYLAMAAFRYFLPPLPSTAHMSSMNTNVRGGQTAFRTWELSLKCNNLQRRWAAHPFAAMITASTMTPTGMGRASALTEGWVGMLKTTWTMVMITNGVRRTYWVASKPRKY